MAWHQHRIKRLKQAEKRRKRNLAAKRRYKKATKEFLALIKENKLEEAKAMFKNIQSIFASTARREIIHKNKASRHIGRLAQKLNQLEKKLSNKAA